MTDEAKPPGEDKCVACDIGFAVLMAAGVAFIAFMAWDVLSGGKATEQLTGLFRKVAPQLATVHPLRENRDDAADSG